LVLLSNANARREDSTSIKEIADTRREKEIPKVKQWEAAGKETSQKESSFAEHLGGGV
jgi:hypothetical protein